MNWYKIAATLKESRGFNLSIFNLAVVPVQVVLKCAQISIPHLRQCQLLEKLPCTAFKVSSSSP